MKAETDAPFLNKTRPPRRSTERKKRAPIAVIECFERIPCDPCGAACPRRAIHLNSLNDPPRLVPERCTGCGQCLSACPGLAIFVVHEHFSEEEALVKVPYEFLPIPKEGGTAWALDRQGRKLHKGFVAEVRENPNRTLVVSIRVPRKIAWEVRNILVAEEKDGG